MVVWIIPKGLVRKKKKRKKQIHKKILMKKIKVSIILIILLRTWIVCSKSDCNPTVLRNTNCTLLWRINMIVAQRVFLGVEVSETPANNIKAIAMQMHRMVITC